MSQLYVETYESQALVSHRNILFLRWPLHFGMLQQKICILPVKTSIQLLSSYTHTVQDCVLDILRLAMTAVSDEASCSMNFRIRVLSFRAYNVVQWFMPIKSKDPARDFEIERDISGSLPLTSFFMERGYSPKISGSRNLIHVCCLTLISVEIDLFPNIIYLYFQ